MTLRALDAPGMEHVAARARFFALLSERDRAIDAAVTLRSIGADEAWKQTLAHVDSINRELQQIVDEHRRGLPRLRERYNYGSAAPDGLLSNSNAAVVRR